MAQRALWGHLEELVSQVLWARRVSQEMPETQDPQELQAPQGLKVKLVKRGTQVHLGLLDPQARKVHLERTEPKGTRAPRGSPEIWGPQETLEFRALMAPQERRETLVMLGGRGRRVLPGNQVPPDPLERGVLRVAWVEKAKRGKKAPRGSQVPMGLQGGQAQWGLAGPLAAWALMVFPGSLALWVNQASWDPRV